MKAYAVQWFNGSTGDWETCNTYEDTTQEGSPRRLCTIYFDERTAEVALEYWLKEDPNCEYAVNKVKIKH